MFQLPSTDNRCEEKISSFSFYVISEQIGGAVIAENVF